MQASLIAFFISLFKSNFTCPSYFNPFGNNFKYEGQYQNNCKKNRNFTNHSLFSSFHKKKKKSYFNKSNL